MTENIFEMRLYDAIENYYQHNPDTLMPLLMVALAVNGKLSITTEENSSSVVVSRLIPSEIKNYDWVALNSTLKRKVNKWNKDGVKSVSIEMEIGRSLMQIYEIFKKNDEHDVVQEHHHRLGRLIHHSSNADSEKAQRQYACMILAEALIKAPEAFLEEEYFTIFNHILEKSGLQPRRPRIEVAQALSTLLRYNGTGLVYNPFAGCSIAGAMIGSKENYYGDGDSNAKVYAAGLLLNYGMGISNEHFIQRDSTQWLYSKPIDYLVTTYTGYIAGRSAFEFCLEKCLSDSKFQGKYAGIVQPKEIFEKEAPAFKEALKKDWIETIVLLPFGEAAVLVNAHKKQKAKGFIRFIDGTNPLARMNSIEKLINNKMFTQIIKADDAGKKGYLKSLVMPELPEREGYTKVRLGDIVKKIRRKVYDLEQFEIDERVIAYINRKETYYGNLLWNENIKKAPISSLYGPAYLLEEDSLIVNRAGLAEPRLFDASWGNAFFNDGYAFSVVGCDDPTAIAEELKETYVRKQLHPYGLNKMAPAILSEDDYLNVILYVEVTEHDTDRPDSESTVGGEAPYTQALEAGYIITDNNKQYRILDFIGNGAFGYTYRAEMFNCNTGAKEVVAIKEYFPTGVIHCTRNGNKVHVEDCHKDIFLRYKEMFRSEYDLIHSMSDIPDNHVTEIKSLFEYEPTGTIYYVMKYYSGESLEDMIIAGQIPSSEQLIIEKIVIPLCKALNAMHSHRILHLDIKPENIVIDENGEAVLIDFGVAHMYDEEGKLISIRDIHSNSIYSAPENRDGHMRYFGPRADIYGTAATLFNLLSGFDPSPIQDNTDRELAYAMMDCSEKMKEAVTEGLFMFANDRPATAQMFLRNFPGCESIKL